MRKSIEAAVGALAIAFFGAPVAAIAVQSGISTNPPPVKTSEYIGAVHALSRYEVDASRLALARSQVQASRSFARRMVDLHTRVIAGHARLLNVSISAEAEGALAEPLSEMLERLESTPLGEFDLAYRQGQIAAHEEALKVHSAYAAQGTDARARAKAQAAIPIIRNHLDAARKLPGA